MARQMALLPMHKIASASSSSRQRQPGRQPVDFLARLEQVEEAETKILEQQPQQPQALAPAPGVAPPKGQLSYRPHRQPSRRLEHSSYKPGDVRAGRRTRQGSTESADQVLAQLLSVQNEIDERLQQERARKRERGSREASREASRERGVTPPEKSVHTINDPEYS